MTAITYNSSDGTRRCDARCHDAQSPECDCICAGVLHGAKSNTVELGARLSKLVDEICGVVAQRRQGSLFEGLDGD